MPSFLGWCVFPLTDLLTHFCSISSSRISIPSLIRSVDYGIQSSNREFWFAFPLFASSAEKRFSSSVLAFPPRGPLMKIDGPYLHPSTSPSKHAFWADHRSQQIPIRRGFTSNSGGQPRADQGRTIGSRRNAGHYRWPYGRSLAVMHWSSVVMWEMIENDRLSVNYNRYHFLFLGSFLAFNHSEIFRISINPPPFLLLVHLSIQAVINHSFLLSNPR